MYNRFLFYLSVSLEFTLMFCAGNRQCVVRWEAGLCVVHVVVTEKPTEGLMT